MEALSYHDKVADSPWKDSCLVLDLAQGDRLPVRYTRAGLPASPYDLKTLDVGRLHIFVDGVAASTNLGLLEVNYEVDLYTPQIQNPVGGLATNNAGLDATHLFGTVATVVVDPEALMPGTFTSTQVFTFDQSFEGLVSFSIGGTGLAADYSAVAAGDGSAYAGGTQIVNAGTTSCVGSYRIRAYPGTTMTPVMTATTVTSVSYKLAKAAYSSLGS
jgi:hypothetical protein